jgi:hypothetical protein
MLVKLTPDDTQHNDNDHQGSIATVSIMTLNIRLSLVSHILFFYNKCRIAEYYAGTCIVACCYSEGHYSEYRKIKYCYADVLSVVMLSFVMLSLVMLNLVM